MSMLYSFAKQLEKFLKDAMIPALMGGNPIGPVKSKCKISQVQTEMKAQEYIERHPMWYMLGALQNPP